jgi:hypothetical protein
VTQRDAGRRIRWYALRMNLQARQILEHLETVEAQRALRSADPALAERVHVLKEYQHQRFQSTYADLLGSPRFAGAARFFLEELYGPGDFSKRDSQFARVVPKLVILFPREVVMTVLALGELHALSEMLDTEMAWQVPPGPLDAAGYQRAWCAVGRAADRERQIRLTRQVGDALDAYTRNPLLRHSLRLMRTPARLAGLSELQVFLEKGFDTFGAMHGAKEFLDAIDRRERTIAAELYRGEAAAP